VRELRNVVQRAYVMASEDVISDEWMPTDSLEVAVSSQISPASSENSTGMNGGTPTASITIPLGISMADAEYQLILATLKHCNNHKERTAAVLGVSLKTLYNRLKEYGAGNKSEETFPPACRRQTSDRRRTNRDSIPD
jgi:DNA-binding NtrC family response regulator